MNRDPIWKLRVATSTPLWFLMYKSYEPGVWKLIDGIHGQLAVDVGANLGQYTIPFARRFRRVIAIEPVIGNLRILKSNLARCGIHNVKICGAVAADSDGERRLHVDARYPLNAAIADEGELHPCSRLDSILGSEGIVDLVKVDVEGAEWQVFRGAEKILSRIRMWLVEVHDISRKEEFDSLLRSRGYETEWVVDPKRLIAPHVLGYR